MKKYVVQRNNIFAGVLFRGELPNIPIAQVEGQGFTRVDLVNSGLSNLQICRAILFKMHELMACDLIYTAPSYPVEGKSSIETVDFVVSDIFSLEDLLNYLGYPENLTQNHVDKIFQQFICSDKWLNRNQKLFGWNWSSYDFYTASGKPVLSQALGNALSNVHTIKNFRPSSYEPCYYLMKKR